MADENPCAEVKDRGRNPYRCTALSVETAEEICERLKETLGGKYFTVVALNSLSKEDERFVMVDVRSSERFEVEPKVRKYSNDHVGIHWETGSYSEGISTSAKTLAEAWRTGRNNFRHDYVRIDFTPNKVTIDHYAPAGYFLRWIYAVERHEEVLDD